jgi:predicted unusual protein kinase regulating ubiquinone biosynthesis (AarF/ABC1/UbiB family)
MHGLDELATSWLRRSGASVQMALRTLGFGARGPLRRLLSAAGRAQELRIADAQKLAQDLREVMGRYKGVMMKAGQMMGYLDLIDLPEAARKILAELQQTSTPMTPEVIERVFREEHGAPPRELFAEWDPVPMAMASIGQVHRARLEDGTEVVVKVQYPEIENAMRSDLRNITLVALLMDPLAGEIGTKEAAREIQKRFLEECDYLLEAEHQERFRALFAQDPEVTVPRVIREKSSRRTLTSVFVDGARFNEFTSTADQPRKNQAGRTIFRFVFTSIFTHRQYNCDPHPGNYLFPPHKVAFLDFGCVRSFEPEFVRTWKALIRSVSNDDRAAFKEALCRLGLVSEKKHFDFDYHFEVGRYLYRPWLTPGPFRYTKAYVEESIKLIVTDNPNKFVTRLPPEFVFVNRLQWGLNSILAALEAEANWSEIMRPLVAEDPAP